VKPRGLDQLKALRDRLQRERDEQAARAAELVMKAAR
jgi:hypothetical protein